MKLKALASCVTIAALFACTGTANATVYYVKAGATGKGKSKAEPAGSVAAILAKVRRGDVVNVAAGEYNGPGGTGEFCVNVPNLSLVGGWNADFSERNPFTNVTILRRKAGVTTNYNKTKGGIICTDPQAHKWRMSTGCSGLIVDGFLIDGSTRNVYTGSNVRLGAQGSWKESLIKLNAALPYSTSNIKIRNCILMNCYNMAIEIKWMGDQNEVVNCLMINNMIAGVDCRAAQKGMGGPKAIKGYPATKVRMAGSTVAFNWVHDKAQMANGIMFGGNGTFVVENNVFAWLAGKKGAEAVRGAGRAQDSVSGNVLWLTCDANSILEKQTTAAQMGGDDDEDEEEEEEEEEESGGGSGGGPIVGNVIADPGFSSRMDKTWFLNFSGRAGREGLFPFEPLNAARAKHDLGPITKLGQAMPPEECAWGLQYPTEIEKIIPVFVADQAGKGFQTDATFETYEERLEADLVGGKPGPKADYTEIQFDDLSKKSANPPKDGAKIKLKVTLRTMGERYGEQKLGYTADNYVQVEMGKPGESTSGNTTNKFFAYLARGSQANNRWNQFGNKKVNAATKGGIWIRGTLLASRQPANSKYPYVIVVDFIGKP